MSAPIATVTTIGGHRDSGPELDPPGVNTGRPSSKGGPREDRAVERRD